MTLESAEGPKGNLHRNLGRNLNPKYLWPHLRLNKSTTSSSMGEPDFILQDIETVIKIIKERAPPNTHVRVGGYVHINESVVSLKSIADITLEVILDYADTYPKPGTLIEVFGKICFNSRSVPYILGYFHRDLHGSYEDYKNLCTRVNALRHC